jgi:hypothetical protein
MKHTKYGSRDTRAVYQQIQDDDGELPITGREIKRALAREQNNDGQGGTDMGSSRKQTSRKGLVRGMRANTPGMSFEGEVAEENDAITDMLREVSEIERRIGPAKTLEAAGPGWRGPGVKEGPYPYPAQMAGHWERTGKGGKAHLVDGGSLVNDPQVVCPRCNGYIPNNETPGAYPGAWSRPYRFEEEDTDPVDRTYVCSECGREEMHFGRDYEVMKKERWPITTPAALERAKRLNFASVRLRTLAESYGVSADEILNRQWQHTPQAKDIPHWRNALIQAWCPTGVFAKMAPTIYKESGGYHRFLPWWEHDTFGNADLWFVGSDMCDLLLRHAPTMPDTLLHRELMPGKESGLVVFERPLASLDATGGTCRSRSAPCCGARRSGPRTGSRSSASPSTHRW